LAYQSQSGRLKSPAEMISEFVILLACSILVLYSSKLSVRIHNKFMDTVDEYGLTQLITQPKRGPNTLDLILKNFIGTLPLMLSSRLVLK
jgi:hypothetical protein